MAERRMFAKSIIDSDAFLDMPLSAQALYFHLSMRADDEGFVGNPRRIRQMVSASEDDLKLLIAKRFLLVFDSGVVVIKHWKIHNYIQNDRAKETTYLEERATLTLDGKKAYTEKGKTECIQNVSNLYPQDRIVEISRVEDSLGEERRDITFTLPKRERACEEIGDVDFQTKRSVKRIAEIKDLTDEEFDIVLKGIKNALQLGCFIGPDFSFLASSLEGDLGKLRDHISKGERNARLIERVIKDYAPKR